MKAPLTASEPLAPKARRPDPPKPAKRRSRLLRIVNGVLAVLFAVVVLGGLAAGAGAWVAYRQFSQDLPDVEWLRNYRPPVMSRVFAGDSRLLAELATERRIFVPFGAIPPVLRQAFISAEDQNFYVHAGVDPLAIARAAVFDVLHAGQGRRPIGASTITQQVAKNMLLDNAMSIRRKVREAILATRIEQELPKDRILELYLNQIYLGLGSYGVAAAAQAYFNKPLDKLTLAEAAFLAALPKAPNNLNPFNFPDAARARRDYVLDRMADDKAITQAQQAAAKAEPVAPAAFRRPPPVPGADWFAEEVRRQLLARFGQEQVSEKGLTVRTSLDPVLQVAAETALRDGLMAYDRTRGGWRGPVARAAVPPADFDTAWPAALNAAAKPPGMLPNWRLAVVAAVTDAEAKVNWLTRTGERRQAPIALAELAWARPLRDGKLGPAPKRVAEVVKPGVIVLIEPPAAQAPAPAAPPPPPPAAPAKGKPAPAPAAPPVPRATLRQVPLVQGALVSLDPRTGRVLAMVGGWSFEQSQYNRVTQANRQPGSSFKPIVYLTALQKGISPSQRILDAPIVVQTPEGNWRPHNYEGSFGGPTSLRVALEESMNLVTLRVAQKVGMAAVADNAIAFHMVDRMPAVLPAALGAVETTVLREAAAYASLAAGGREVTPTLIDSVQDVSGHIVWRAQGADTGGLACEACADPAVPPALADQRTQLADPASTFQLVTMMQGVVRRGTGAAAGKGLNRPIAGKTGTTQDFGDAWFSGFTPDLVTTVWVGFDNPVSLGNNATGGSIAAPIWRDYMAQALAGRPVLSFPVPPGVTLAQWDTGSGSVTDAFKPDQMPGASGPVITGFEAPAVADGSAAAAPVVHGGIDNSLGGLY
jgi:penicillin-binding protein 1A